jgi:hypothetical protein
VLEWDLIVIYWDVMVILWDNGVINGGLMSFQWDIA